MACHRILASQSDVGGQFPDYSKPLVLWDELATNKAPGYVVAPDNGVLYISMQSDKGWGARMTYIYDQTGNPVQVNNTDRSGSNTSSFFVKKGDMFSYTASWVNRIVFYPFRKQL